MRKMSMKKQEERPQEFNLDYLFDVSMKKNWKEVLRIYKAFEEARKAKLTKSEETALHIAVSSYHDDPTDADEHVKIVRQLVEAIRTKEEADEVLKMENEKGDTPLHLAAALGSEPICRCIAGKHIHLIKRRNHKGETPLYLAAHHGKMEAFVYLDDLYKYADSKEVYISDGKEVDVLHGKEIDVSDGKEADESPESSPWRRKDGDTILHSAISGEYFELAYRIINDYPKLVNSVNEEGFSPLHVLARKPNIFESSSNFRLFDQLIYRWVIVHELKQPTSSSPVSNIVSPCCRYGAFYPDNYDTCVNLFSLPWAALRIIVPFGGKDCGSGGSTSCIADEENLTDRDEELEGEGYKKKASFPPNYTTGILLFKFFVNILLTMFGVGIWRIGKIKQKKGKHRIAVQIMTELIQKESRYKYDHNGQTPKPELVPNSEERFTPPSRPPQESTSEKDFQERSQPERDITEKVEKKHETATQRKDAKKLTPVLLAAKMGITEMVRMILETFPVAIQDLDENEKNALLVAVENRQTEVYNLLLKMKLPEFVLYQVDDEGNSATHLAAKFEKHQPWRIPGAALQMQWEIKWYKHVKHTMTPHCFIQYNKKGETATEIFRKTHEGLVKNGSEWVTKTSESCSLVAALIATVAFATSSTVPGGPDQTTGIPLLEHDPAFMVFAITSIGALCFSVTALVFFLAILTSRCQQQDFKHNLPRKLLFGMSSLFTSIAAILLSFCAGHFFLIREQLQNAAFPIYTVACLPITFFAFAQLPLYFDLWWSISRKVPLRSYKVYYS